jgi:hypothetical protein
MRGLWKRRRADASRRRAVLLALAIALCIPGSAMAVVLGLPFTGAQVNNDPTNGIDPSQNAGVSDVVGGSLTAGGPRVPWATFEQKAASAQHIFVRAFKNGSWVTQGQSLNINAAVEAEAPSIDFAGAGRTVPWDSWYEPSPAFGGVKQIFASRFCAATSAACSAANAWVPEGQDRGSGLPSLNIHTNKDAENPQVAGGAAVAGKDPVPWVVWQEEDGSVAATGNHDQIFVAKAVKQGAAHQPCTGFKPSANASVSFFCWQQVGLERLAANDGSSSAGDPTLNIDPSRDGVEPDISFTGPSDTVAWVVWYEQGSSALGLRTNQQVFAAKLVADPAADGGFHWQPVGNGTAGQVNVLDTSGAHSFGACAGSSAAEDACALNKVPSNNAEDPSVATGTLTPGGTTVPWVAWAEDIGGGRHGVFVSRLVGGNHFELFNGGNPVSNPGHDAATPDITFFGNTPYVSWTETEGGSQRGFAGHFQGTTFVLDTPGGIRLTGDGRAKLIAARVPISSSCTADPFTSDGSACPVAAINDPFFLFTTADSPQRLFGQAVLACPVIVGCVASVQQEDSFALISASLDEAVPVGILVERFRGGRLVRVGRVPLGRRHRGQVRIRWSLRVNGRKLAKGRYVITLRALDRHQRIIARARGVTINIH